MFNALVLNFYGSSSVIVANFVVSSTLHVGGCRCAMVSTPAARTLIFNTCIVIVAMKNGNLAFVTNVCM